MAFNSGIARLTNSNGNKCSKSLPSVIPTISSGHFPNGFNSYSICTFWWICFSVKPEIPFQRPSSLAISIIAGFLFKISPYCIIVFKLIF